MTCHSCWAECRRFGKRKGRQRYQCRLCHKLFTEPRENHLDGMYTPLDRADTILRLLVEGNSVSSVERITDTHHTTILSLLGVVGAKLERFLESRIKNV